MTRIVIWKARFPRVRYAWRARPGPPEKATKMTPRPTRIHGMRKIQTFIRRGILVEADDGRGQADVPSDGELPARGARPRRVLARRRRSGRQSPRAPPRAASRSESRRSRTLS